MVRSFVIGLIAVGFSGSALAQKARDPALEFDGYVTQAVKDWKAVGLAVTVVKDGKVVFAKGYGVRELGKPEPVDTNTLFAIGSTTKAITSAAVGMLVDDGKVNWDDPVTKYLPWFQLKDPFLTREVTVRDLLTHRAGLVNADVLWYETDLKPEEILRRARFVDIGYSLRSDFIYQNVMYAAAGAVVAAASGMPWEEFIRTRIFGPLGMNGSVPTLAETRSQPNVASPHDIVNDTTVVIQNVSVDPVAAAGSIWSSVADMGKWARFMLDSGRVNGQRLLKPQTFAELFKPQAILRSAMYPTAQLVKPHWMTYGMGWFQQDYAGRAMQFHTGSIDGMVAIIGLIPDDRIGVYVLANRDHVELRHALVYKGIDLWLGIGNRDWSKDLLGLYGRIAAAGDSARKAAESRRVAGTQPSLPLEKYAGTYGDSLLSQVEVGQQDGKLRLQAGSKRWAELEHWHYDTFRARWNHRWQGTSTVTFHLNARGEVGSMDFDGETLSRLRGRPSDTR
jgi:CubicO group peptidase (beta-lactamase class C family)